MPRLSSRKTTALVGVCLGALSVGAVQAVAQSPPPSITLSGTVRDFSQAHPDFEPAAEGSDREIVRSRLGANKKPVYKPAGSSRTTSGKANFDQWYRDVAGVNMARALELEALLVPNSSPPLYRFGSDAFFPIDGELIGNEGRSHNFHFTYETHSRFTYNGGEIFTFKGDDDVWLFLNGRLVLDLGGVHTTQVAKVDLDAVAASIGLEKGRSYDFDLFFAERATAGSNFQFETTVELEPTPAPSPASGGVAPGVEATLGQPAGAACAPVPPRNTSEKGSIKLTKQALIIQQKIDAAALRRLNAANAWIDQGIVPTDLCGNGVGSTAFQPGISWGDGPSGSNAGLPDPRPLNVIKKQKPPANFTLSLRQIAINDRISEALLRRATATAERLSSLTGGNLADGAMVTGRARPQDLVAGAPVPPSTEPGPTPLQIGPKVDQGKLTFTAGQLRKTQQRSQSAIVIANRVNDRIRAGLTEEQFQEGSIGSGRVG